MLLITRLWYSCEVPLKQNPSNASNWFSNVHQCNGTGVSNSWEHYIHSNSPPRSPQPSENPHMLWPRGLCLNIHYQLPGKLKHCTWKASATTSKPLSQPTCQSGLESSGREQTAGEKAGCARFAFVLFVALCACIHFIAMERGRDTLLTWLKFWTFCHEGRRDLWMTHSMPKLFNRSIQGCSHQ